MRDSSGNNVEAMLSAVFPDSARENHNVSAESEKEEQNSDPSGALSVAARDYLVCRFPPDR
jgi:hypothetical protein